ncbi:MAG: hypothetical protein Q8M39_05190 [Sulfuricurvum sp.]|nr:hypothetical protein [Sulfuricurvum sp.]
MLKETAKISLLLACLIGSNSYAAGDASQALQSIQWATAEVGNAVSQAKQIEQITLATNNLQQNIQAVQMAQQNLEALSAMDVSNFNSYINQLSSMMVSTNGIAYNMANLDDKFSATFPGYDEHMKRGTTGSIKDQASSFSQYYKSLTDQNRGTALGTLRNLKAVNKDLQDDALNMNMLKLQSRNAVGNKAAIQAANEIAMHQTDTLKKLHSSMLMQTNLMAQASAQQNEEKAATQASRDAWIAKSKKSIKGNEPNIKTW